MLNKKFVEDGINVRIFNFDDSLAKDKLAPGIYTVCYNMFSGFFLQKNKDKYEVAQKTYGTLEATANRIINTYEQRTSGTGVLLTGLKGSGKTLLSQTVSNKMIEKGLPIILVEEAHSGDAFISFLNSIGECVLIFDEFTKVFSAQQNNEKNHQDDLLGIFDGNKSLKRLIFVIDNHARQVNEFYTNRPGRLFYHFEYSKLEELVIDEYCADFKIPEDVVAQLKSAYYRIRSFSFDILKAIVDEYLRYPEERIVDIINVLNIDTESYYNTMLTLKRIVKKDTAQEYELYKKTDPKEYRYHEASRIDLLVKEKGLPIDKPEEEALDENLIQYVTVSQFNVVFEKKDIIVFSNDGFMIEFEKTIKSSYDYMAF